METIHNQIQTNFLQPCNDKLISRGEIIDIFSYNPTFLNPRPKKWSDDFV